MDLAYDIVLYTVTAIAFVFTGIFHLHMFQLNSYSYKEYQHWLFRNSKVLFMHVLFAVMCTLIATSGFAVKIIELLGLFTVVWFFFPKKAKKPLVYTMRVKRLVVTLTIIVIVPLGLVFIYCREHLILVAGLIFIAFYFVIMLANLINSPIEKGVNQRYINDAKKILKGMPDLKIIGVTGSYGKTSVKFYLGDLLKVKYNVLVTPESYNTPMGVVKTIRGSLQPIHNIFVCEMGAKKVGEIKEICDIVHPHHGVITSIGPQHLETFGSLDNIKKTKFELADALPQNGMLFLNGDNEHIASVDCKKAAIRYGIGGGNNYTASDIKVSDIGTKFTVTDPEGNSQEFSTQLLGEHNVINVLGAIAVATSFGIKMQQLRLAVKNLKPVPHRLQLMGTPDRIIIDDAYNSNPSGTVAALSTLNLFSGCKIIVTPGMVELGTSQDELNRKFGVDIAAVCDYAILVGKKQTKPIFDGLADAKYPQEKTFVVSSISEAMAVVDGLPETKKVILLENDLPDDYAEK